MTLFPTPRVPTVFSISLSRIIQVPLASSIFFFIVADTIASSPEGAKELLTGVLKFTMDGVVIGIGSNSVPRDLARDLVL
jgi:hypothetical protein